jgi:hypothetical protein
MIVRGYPIPEKNVNYDNNVTKEKYLEMREQSSPQIGFINQKVPF